MEHKTIELEVTIPVRIRVLVTWDAKEGQTKIHRAEYHPIQSGRLDRFLEEWLCESDLEQLDEMARKVCTE